MGVLWVMGVIWVTGQSMCYRSGFAGGGGRCPQHAGSCQRKGNGQCSVCLCVCVRACVRLFVCVVVCVRALAPSLPKLLASPSIVIVTQAFALTSVWHCVCTMI